MMQGRPCASSASNWTTSRATDARLTFDNAMVTQRRGDVTGILSSAQRNRSVSGRLSCPPARPLNKETLRDETETKLAAVASTALALSSHRPPMQPPRLPRKWSSATAFHWPAKKRLCCGSARPARAPRPSIIRACRTHVPEGTCESIQTPYAQAPEPLNVRSVCPGAHPPIAPGPADADFDTPDWASSPSISGKPWTVPRTVSGLKCILKTTWPKAARDCSGWTHLRSASCFPCTALVTAPEPLTANIQRWKQLITRYRPTISNTA